MHLLCCMTNPRSEVFQPKTKMHTKHVTEVKEYSFNPQSTDVEWLAVMSCFNLVSLQDKITHPHYELMVSIP